VLPEISVAASMILFSPSFNSMLKAKSISFSLLYASTSSFIFSLVIPVASANAPFSTILFSSTVSPSAKFCIFNAGPSKSPITVTFFSVIFPKRSVVFILISFKPFFSLIFLEKGIFWAESSINSGSSLMAILWAKKSSSTSPVTSKLKLLVMGFSDVAESVITGDDLSSLDSSSIFFLTIFKKCLALPVSTMVREASNSFTASSSFP